MMVRASLYNLWDFPNSILTAKGLAARSTLEAPAKDSIPNPNRPSNPFSPQSESDWVVVPKLSVIEVESTPRPVKRKPIVGHDSTVPLSRVSQNKAQALVVQHDQTRGTSPLTSSQLQEWGVTRKPAPPVPRKPPILTSSESSRTSSLGGVLSSVPANQRILIRRVGGTQTSTLPSDSAKFQGVSARANRSPPPSNRASSAQRDIPKDLLGKADESACLIPTIQPVRES